MFLISDLGNTLDLFFGICMNSFLLFPYLQMYFEWETKGSWNPYNATLVRSFFDKFKLHVNHKNKIT